MKQAFEVARTNSKKAALQSAKQYNKAATAVTYKVGDKVYLKKEAIPKGKNKKLAYRYSGPYRITNKLDETTFELTPVLGGKT